MCNISSLLSSVSHVWLFSYVYFYLFCFKHKNYVSAWVYGYFLSHRLTNPSSLFWFYYKTSVLPTLTESKSDFVSMLDLTLIDFVLQQNILLNKLQHLVTHLKHPVSCFGINPQHSDLKMWFLFYTLLFIKQTSWEWQLIRLLLCLSKT